PARHSDVWKITREASDEIEIATWRPTPFARPQSPTPTEELEFSVDGLEDRAATAEPPLAGAAPVPPPGPAAAPSAPASSPAPPASTSAGRGKPAKKKEPAGKPAAERAPQPPPPIPLEQARERILSAQARDEIAEAALDHLSGSSPLVALFIARKDDVIGWQARGEGVSRTALRSIRIPFTEPSIFLNVKLSGTPYAGLLPELPSHAALLGGLGHRPGRCAVYPVSLKNRVVAFILMEIGPDGQTAAEKEDLAALASSMAEGFAALILQQRGRAESA
ncbi:MAG TPA: hypothetical protein VG777_02995, partial [Thermoanaerobaculia bacterium]|nr:hypothetical protein [Thermoanaerobaculia bacterium]